MEQTNNQPTSMRDIVTNQYVFNHLVKLQSHIKSGFTKKKHIYNDEIMMAVSESPITTAWIKDIVIPKLYDGDEGLEEILDDIELQDEIAVSATRMQLLLQLLSSLPYSLNELREGTEQGYFNVEHNMDVFEDTQREFKFLH